MASRFCRKFRVLVVGALAISALAASPALAGGGGSSYKCSATPTLVTGGVSYTITGSGFPAGMVVNVYIKDKIATWIVSPAGAVASNGTFISAPISSAIFYPSDLGTKTVTVVNAYDKRTTTLATCSFSVK